MNKEVSTAVVINSLNAKFGYDCCFEVSQLRTDEERAFRRFNPELNFTPHRSADGYQYQATQDVWEQWQRTRRDLLEKAENYAVEAIKLRHSVEVTAARKTQETADRRENVISEIMAALDAAEAAMTTAKAMSLLEGAPYAGAIRSIKEAREKARKELG